MSFCRARPHFTDSSRKENVNKQQSHDGALMIFGIYFPHCSCGFPPAAPVRLTEGLSLDL